MEKTVNSFIQQPEEIGELDMEMFQDFFLFRRTELLIEAIYTPIFSSALQPRWGRQCSHLAKRAKTQ